jgi:hypothetical protein
MAPAVADVLHDLLLAILLHASADV